MGPIKRKNKAASKQWETRQIRRYFGGVIDAWTNDAQLQAVREHIKPNRHVMVAALRPRTYFTDLTRAPRERTAKMRIPKTAPNVARRVCTDIRPLITLKKLREACTDQIQPWGKGSQDWTWINDNRTDDAIYRVVYTFDVTIGDRRYVRTVILTTGYYRPDEPCLTLYMRDPKCGTLERLIHVDHRKSCEIADEIVSEMVSMINDIL